MKKDGMNRYWKYMLSVLVPVLLLTAVFFTLSYRSIISLASEKLLQQSSDNADKINSYMDEVVGDMEDIRELCERNCSNDEEVFAFIRSTENYGVFNGAYTGDNTGFYVGSTPWDIPDDYDPTTRPWYIDGKDSRDFVFGEPYMDASEDKMCVSVSARMDAGDDSIVRVIASDIYLDYMDSLAEELVSTSDLDGAVIVTDDGSVIVADSSGQYAGENLEGSSEFYALLKENLLGKDSGIYELKDSEKCYATVQDVPVTGWKLITYERKSVILKDLYRALLIMSLAAVGVSLFLIRLMQRYGKEVSEVEQQANKAKTEFISRISHDIRTPIGQVLNLTAFAKQDKEDPEKLSEDLDRIDSSGKFLLSLINDVLDVSQIESGLMEMHPVRVSHETYMKDIRNLMVPMCENKGLEWEIDEGSEELPDMYCDEVRLKQITLNLISNAVKYTPSGGKVSYLNESHGNEDGSLSLAFTIKDNGVGMTKEFMEHMFERFTRDTENELRDSTQMGSGLGLYLVKNMVELMGGTISYESEKGKGTSATVRMELPKAPDVKEERTEETVQEENTKFAGTVLLVEDNMLNMEIASRMLEEMGLRVERANDGEEAVEKFNASDLNHYRLIFMDLQMPKKNGYEASAAIRELNREDAKTIPIAAMTADAFTKAKEESEASGMTDFITKPLIISEIQGILTKYGMKAE